MNKMPYKVYLNEDETPKAWHNLRVAMKEKPEPFLNPATKEPCTLEELSGVFIKELVKQELNNTDEYIPIPEELLTYYRTFRPSPLVRAAFLEKALGTPAKIFYKYEGNNTSGSHKLNSSSAQAYYAKQQGLKRLVTETGAGQWGCALSMACAHFGVDLTVYMVRKSSEEKPYRKTLMETFGATVIPSPSETTAFGRHILAESPEKGISLGVATSEAIEVATANSADTRYSLGSFLNYVLLHQSVIGIEVKTAFEKYDLVPDIIIGCSGGGSNMGGLMSAYMADRIRGKNNIEFIASEPASCPTLTRGVYAIDYCDIGCTTPLIKMYTLGNGFVPPPHHAGGLRYHAMSPIVSKLYHEGYIRGVAHVQSDIFDAAVMFARAEGVLPAPESAHAIKAAIDEAVKCRQTGEEKVILFGLSGTGYFDMTAYAGYNSGRMTDHVPTDEELERAFATLPV